jgi:hypothetical protein
LFFEGDKKEVILDCYKQLLLINPNMEVIGINGKSGNITNHIPFITNKEQISILAFKIDDFFVDIFNTTNIEELKAQFIKDYNYYKNTASIIFFPFEQDTNHFLDFIQNEEYMHTIYGGVYSKSDSIGCFYNGGFYENSMIGVFFNQEKVEFFSLAIHGWKPIGIPFKVTKADKNILYELNNEPALKVIEEYIGEIKQENIDNFLHPFCVKHKEDKSLASLKYIDRENNSIHFFKYIYEDEEVLITIPINQKNMMKLIEEKLQGIKCDALFMFSCIGRYAYYKDLVEFEIEKVNEVLNVPFAGFLTYGEIGSNTIKTKSILQNQTMDLIFLRKKGENI